MSEHNTDSRSALITGATSGIGAAFARQLASEGYSLIIHGRREEKLRALETELVKHGAKQVQLILGDLSQRAVIDSLSAEALKQQITYLINNAGYGAGKDFLNDDEDSQMGMLYVHCQAVALLCRAIIPSMVERGYGKVINVSSIAGEQTLPLAVMYGATKAFLTSFSEALALELSDTGVHIQALLPGFTHTDFHDKLPEWEREKRSRGIIRWMQASDVAAYSLKKIRVKKPGIIAVPGLFNKLLVRIPKILPRRLYYVVAKSVTA